MSVNLGRVMARGKASVDIERENFEKTQVIGFVYMSVIERFCARSGSGC